MRDLLITMLQMWLALLAGVILFQLLTRRINVVGLLTDRNGRIVPEKAQQLVAALLVLLFYLLDAAGVVARGGASLPEPGAELIALLGGSGLLSVLGEGWRRFAKRD